MINYAGQPEKLPRKAIRSARKRGGARSPNLEEFAVRRGRAAESSDLKAQAVVVQPGKHESWHAYLLDVGGYGIKEVSPIAPV